MVLLVETANMEYSSCPNSLIPDPCLKTVIQRTHGKLPGDQAVNELVTI